MSNMGFMVSAMLSTHVELGLSNRITALDLDDCLLSMALLAFRMGQGPEGILNPSP